MRPSLVVSIHDVAPSTACAARAWVEELDRRHVPAPGCTNAATAATR
jgi:hypothetical protein